MPLHIYLPQDRLRALVTQSALPDRANGAALFADISGFTALTEALRNVLGARRGEEELTRRIEAVYSALITQIELFGGSVIDFAGDSMLCWFDEDLSLVAEIESLDAISQPAAAHLAVACGVALQRAMRAFAKILLPDKSTTALTLKVAIASGTARRFVVGDTKIRRMDTLAGVIVARTAAAEHLARAGEVLIDKFTANILGDGITIQEWREDSDSREGFAVIRGLTQPIDPPVLMQLDAGHLVPEELHPWIHSRLVEREQSGQVSFLSEFRPCTTLFVRFIGIDFDSDTAAIQLNTFIESAQQIAARHGGTLMDITIGDKGSYSYINFGVFSAHEDDARRAVCTALELGERIKQLDFLQPLQIGITHGTLRVGAYGGQTRKTFGALGDEVNLAARLMMKAAPGEILLSNHVHKAVEPYFVFEPRPPVPMKGKAEPVPVFAVTGERQQRAIRLQEPTYALPMVGRADELKIIEEKLDLTRSGKSQVIGIIAEAGMGKSRLVAEVIRLAHRMGFVGYGGACQSDGINTPYLCWKAIWSAFFDIDPAAPLKKQMRHLKGEIEDRAPNRLQAMPLLNAVLDMEMPENDFTSSLEPKYRKNVLTALFEDCLRAAAKDEPILIVIEDVHWMDALSHDLLEDLAKRLMDSRICFVLAYRPPQLTSLQAPHLEALSQFIRIELHELDSAEAEQAIRAKLAQLYPARSGAVPTQLINTLRGRAQGNPFYLEELLNYLHDRGLNPQDLEDLERIELPDSLHTLVLSRIDQLSEHEKITLRVASIVGRLFRAAWLAGYYPALGDLARVKVDLDKLDNMDITPLDSEPELIYVFKHIVTHEVTYESLPFATRAKLHEQLATYLESQVVAGVLRESSLLDVLVFHYTCSNNHMKQREYLRKAVQAAVEVGAYITAAKYLTRLVEITPADAPERFAQTVQLATLYKDWGDYGAARIILREAQVAATTDADRATALALLGETMSQLGDYAEAQTLLAEAASLARASGDSLALCSALYADGDLSWRLGKLTDAKVALNESLALARALGNVRRELPALNLLATIMRQEGDTTESERIYEEVHARALAVGNRLMAMVALNNLGTVATQRRDYTAARDNFEKALALAHEIGAQQRAALYLLNRAGIDIKLGQLAAARLRLHEGLVLAVRFGVPPLVVFAVMTFAELAHAEGQTDWALALMGLARHHPAWDSEAQSDLDTAFAQWALDPSVAEVGMAKGAEMDWDNTIDELLNA